LSFAQLASLDSTTLWNAIESAAEEASFGVFVAQLEGPSRLLYVNRRAAEIIGRPAGELLGQVPWAILREADKDIVRSTIERAAEAPPTTLELVVERPDGSEVPIVLAATRMKTPIGLLSFGYFRDVTAERETRAALARSEARFRFLVEAAPDGVVILKRGVIAFINPKAALLLGVDPPSAAIGRMVAEFLPPADAANAASRIQAMLRDGVEFPPSEYGVLADRTRVVEIKSIVCEWDGGPAVLAFARDVTERREIQRRLVEADRLAALGTLAAGVAHEINNPLTYAQLSAQRIARLVETSGLPRESREALRTHLADIDHGISRIASITQSLRSFVRQDESPSGPVDLDAVITSALKMVDNDLRHAAQLVRETVAMPAVFGTAGRLEQVLVNVLLNAIKALAPSTKRHEIHVATSVTGDRVSVAIRDTGRGIPAELRGRVFDPFFTTRAVGEGMGLGLSVSKTIVDGFGGEIELESTEHVGTTVRIHLRRADQASTAVRPEEPGEAPARRRILVVDDEVLICNVLARMLAFDHDVTTALSGEAALAALATADFDLVLVDVMMPGVNGLELHERIAAEQPGVERRIAFMTGGVFHPEIRRALDALPNVRLAKPFKIDQIVELLAAPLA
jgi:PAS domain S-box-containing protein